VLQILIEPLCLFVIGLDCTDHFSLMVAYLAEPIFSLAQLVGCTLNRFHITISTSQLVQKVLRLPYLLLTDLLLALQVHSELLKESRNSS
jgi:hypothetical protein